MPTDAWDPFDHLYQTIKETLAPLGVTVEQWQILPGRDRSEPRIAQLLFTIGPEAFMTEEQKLLKGIEEATKIAEADQRAQQRVQTAKEGLLRLSRTGIFPEDDTPEE